MTYDSPFWAIKGEVIPEVANFEEEGLVTQTYEKEEKKLNPGHLGEMPECWPLHYLNIGIRRRRF